MLKVYNLEDLKINLLNMYDIKIFIEKDGSFGGKINAGKEVIYGVGKTHNDLINSLKEGLELAFENKIENKNVSKISSFLSFNQEDKYASKL